MFSVNNHEKWVELASFKNHFKPMNYYLEIIEILFWLIKIGSRAKKDMEI